MVPTLPPPPPQRPPWSIPLIVGAVVGALVVWRACAGGRSPSTAPITAAPTSTESTARLPPPPRCAEISVDPFVIGEPPPTTKGPSGDPDAGADPTEEPVDPIAPFAVEVGRGTVIEGGFAAGVLRDGEGSAVAMVATVDSAGRNGKIVRLGRTRGDLDPPVITRAGSSILAAMLEPNAGGRAVKVAKVTGTEVTWGAEFAEGHDDSLTVDLAASGTRALVVWDDVLGTAEHDRRSSVMLGSFDVETMRSATAARPVSAPAIDAASPRIVARPGGYWLAYLARGDADAKQPAKKGEDEEDDTAEGEAITTGWVEVVPLDENGAPVSTPRAVTPKKGYAHSFDIEIGEDGGLLVAFRDDDTPTGAGGGKLSAVFVRLGGVGQPRVLAEEAPGLGIPDLLPGFISVSSTTGATRVATLSPRGELLDELAPEPSLGTGHPLAAARDTFLWARPLGRAMRLSVVRCGPRALGDAGAPPGG